MENSYQKFSKDVLIVGITNFLTAISGIFIMPLITKLLGARDYGIWSQAQVTMSLVVGLAVLGLPFTMTRFLPSMTDKEEMKDAFYSMCCMVLLSSAVVLLVIFLGADPIADAFFDGETGIVRITGLIIFVWSLDLTLLTFYRTFRHMLTYSIFHVVNVYGQIGVVAYLASHGYGINSIILAVLVVNTLVLIALLILVPMRIGIEWPHFHNMKKYLYFGIPTIPGNISAWLAAYSDKYIIAYYLGTTSVGVYSAAYAIGTIPTMFATVLGFVLPPALSKAYDEDRRHEVRVHIEYSLKYYLALVIPFTIGSIVLAKPVLLLFSTPEIADEGYYLVPIIAAGIMLYGVYIVIAHIFALVNKTKIMGLIWVIAGVVNLGLNIVFVPLIGILGAALTTLFSYFLALIIGGYLSFREFRFSIDWIFIIKSIVASSIMTAIIWLINPSTNLATLVCVAIGILIYAILIILFRGFKREEFALLRSLFKRGTPSVDDGE